MELEDGLYKTDEEESKNENVTDTMFNQLEAKNKYE
tara:strand:+ start:489 stop:596 length:108 start_codon:yes stop_codon:yes gene_type:complete